MGWFRRNRDEEHEAEPEPGDAAIAAPPDGDVIRAERAHVGDWMSLPPIPRTIGAPPTTFRVQRLPEIMTTRRATAFLGQLGHQVSAAAPSGTVEGLTSAVLPTRAEPHHTDLPLRVPSHAEPDDVAAPIQRRAAPTTPVSASGGDHSETPEISRPLPDVPRPVVQRELAVSAGPAPTAPIRAAALPEPTATRVLREPARHPGATPDRPLPSLPIVAAPGTTSSAEAPVPAGDDYETAAETAPVTPPAKGTGDFVVPEHPVEFTFHAPPAPPPDAPLTGDATPEIAPPATDTTGRDTDLPLAAGAAASGAQEAELMPPIQPRAIQRKAEEAATHVAPLAGDRALPPWPEWARSGVQTEAGGSDSGASDGPSPTLRTPPAAHTPSTPAVQRAVADDDDHPAPTPPGDHSGGGVAMAPLSGDQSLGTATSRGGPQVADDDTSAAVDLPLHAVGDAPANVQREIALQRADIVGAEPPPEPAAGAEPSEGRPEDSNGADAGRGDDGFDIAPLLGDRPLQLQRAIDIGGAEATDRAAPVSPALPLVADAAPGPTISDAPARPGASASPSASASATATAIPAAAGAGAGALAGHSASAYRAQTTTFASPVQRMTEAARDGGAPAALRRLPATATPISGAAGAATAAGTADAFARAGALARPLAVQTLADGGSNAGASVAASTGFAPAAGLAPSRGTAATPATPTPATESMPLQEPAQPDSGQLIGDLAVAAGLGQRASDGSVVFTASSESGRSPFEGGTSMSLQREADGSSPGPATDTASFVVQRAETTTATAVETPSDTDDEKKTDELAAKVYERIRWKLAAEMRADERRIGSGHWNRKGR